MEDVQQAGLAQLLGDGVSIDALLALGSRELRLGRLSDAVETLEVTTTLWPTRPEPWRLLAQAHRSLGDEEAADSIEQLAQHLEKQR